MESETVSLLREMVREVLAEKKTKGRRKGRRKKTGGPRSRIGAIRQLQPNTFLTKVNAAISDNDGDVHRAAADLDIAPRTLYGYIADEPKLDLPD